MPQALITVNNVTGSLTNVAVGSTVQLSNANIGGETTYLWTITYQPAGAADSITGPTTQSPTITVNKEDTYRVTVLVNSNLSASAVIGVRRVKNPTIRVPASGETSEAGNNGWSQDLNYALDYIDTKTSDPGISVVSLAASGLTTGSVVMFSGTTTIKFGLPGQEDVMFVSQSYATLLQNASQPLGIVVGPVTGSTLTSGSLAFVRRFGLHQLTVGGNIGDTVYLTDTATISNVPGTNSRLLGKKLSPTQIYFDGAAQSGTGGGGTTSGSFVGGNAWVDGGNKIKTTSSIAVDPAGGYAASQGTDVVFYVSGSIGISAGSGARKIALFGGDLIVSGGISGSHTQLANGASFLLAGGGISITTQSNGQVLISGSAQQITNLAGSGGTTVSIAGSAYTVSSSIGANLFGSYIEVSADGVNTKARTLAAGTNITFADAGAGSTFTINAASISGTFLGGNAWIDGGSRIRTTSSVAVDPGGGFAAAVGSDVVFYVSGSSGFLQGSAARKVAVFGGDLVVSGNIAIFDSGSVQRAFISASNHGAAVFGGGSGDYRAYIGPSPGSEASAASLFFASPTTSIPSANANIRGDASFTYLNSPANGIFFYTGGTQLAVVTSTAFTFSGVALLQWAASIGSPTINQAQQSGNAAANALLVQSQQASVGANPANANGGNLNLFAGLGYVTGTTGMIIMSSSLLQVTGAANFNNGLSGSLTKLINGSSYLLAGTNITITSQSNGQILIAASGGGSTSGSFLGGNAWIDGGGTIRTTSSVAIDSAGAYAATQGSDVYFYVSGSQGLSAGAGARKIALFGGDAVVSGSLTFTGSNAYVQMAGQSSRFATAGDIRLGTNFTIKARNLNDQADMVIAQASAGSITFGDNNNSTFGFQSGNQMVFTAGTYVQLKGTNTYIADASGNSTISLVGGTTLTRMDFLQTLGAQISHQAIGSNVAPGYITITAGASWQNAGASPANANGGNLNLNAGNGFYTGSTGNIIVSGSYLTTSGSIVTFMDNSGVQRASINPSWRGRATFGGGSADAYSMIGPAIGHETSTNALYMLGTGTLATANNAVLMSDAGSYTYLMAGANAVLMGIHGYNGTFNTYTGGGSYSLGQDCLSFPMMTLDYNSQTNMRIVFKGAQAGVNTAGSTIIFEQRGTDLPTTALTLQGQQAFGTASPPNNGGGNVNIYAGTGLTTGTTGNITLSGSLLQMSGGMVYTNRIITGSYVIDSFGNDMTLFLSMSGGTITMPKPTQGRRLTLKDISGSLANSGGSVSLTGSNGSKFLEGLAGAYTMQAAFMKQTWECDINASWWIVG